jgi:hypothetical protein
MILLQACSALANQRRRRACCRMAQRGVALHWPFRTLNGRLRGFKAPASNVGAQAVLSHARVKAASVVVDEDNVAFNGCCRNPRVQTSCPRQRPSKTIKYREPKNGKGPLNSSMLKI